MISQVRNFPFAVLLFPAQPVDSDHFFPLAAVRYVGIQRDIRLYGAVVQADGFVPPVFHHQSVDLHASLLHKADRLGST